MSAHTYTVPPDPIKRQLVMRAREGDPAAWDQLVRRHQGLLYSIARRYRLREDDVADVVQTTWLRCFENIHRLRQPESLATWLCTTCHREAQRVARAQDRQVLDDTSDAGSKLAVLAEPDRGPLEHAVQNDDRTQLRRAIAELPPRQRDVLTEFLREDAHDYAAHSRRLGMPLGSLGPTRRRAMDVLRQDSRLILAG